MWPWLLVIVPLILPSHLTPSFAASSTSLGPTNEEEAKILWEESQAAIQKSDYSKAAYPLQRLVDRYPGTAHYIKAHFFLGQALLESGKAAQSRAPLKYFITASRPDPDSARCRNWLGNADLALKKYEEAYLTSLEVIQIGLKTQLPSDITVEALLIKTRALLGLKEEKRAEDAFNSAQAQLNDQTSPEVKGKTFNLGLSLKTRSCSRLPSQEPLTEIQARDQLNRRGTCCLEALLLFHEVLKSQDPRSINSATKTLNEAYQNYFKAASHPPTPPPLDNHDPSSHGHSYNYSDKKKRTAVQLKRYKLELADLLLQDFKKNSYQAIDLLKSWNPELPSSSKKFSSQVSDTLTKLSSRIP